MKMKATLSFLMVFIIPLIVSSQTPDWIWAKTSSACNSSKTNDVARDSHGNIIVVGYFQSASISFDGITLIGNNTSVDLFIVKYDPSGSVLWAKSVYNTGMDIAQQVEVDGNDNIIIAGRTSSSSLTFGTTTLTNTSGFNSPFVVKYNSAGNVIWAKIAVCQSHAYALALAIDGNNNIFVSGYFSGMSIGFGTQIVYGGFSEDIFLTKYDSNGNVVWAKGEGSDYQEWCVSLSVDGSGNLLMTGIFNSSSLMFGSTTLTNAGQQDAFIVKYNNDGTVLWAKQAGGTLDDYPGGIVADAIGNVYLIGTYKSSSINFGITTLNNSYLNYEDVFLAKFNSSGVVQWAQKIWGYGTETGSAIARDLNGYIYISGFFSDATLNFGSISLTNVNPNDIFVAKFDSIGTVKWAQAGKGTDDEFVSSICTDASGNAFVAGDFQSPTLTFGSCVLTHTNPINNFPNMYVAKVGAPNGVNDNKINKYALKIFPNPLKEKLHVDIQENFNEMTLLIYDLFGKEIKRIKFNKMTNELDLSNLTYGVYFVTIIINNDILNYKIVKE